MTKSENAVSLLGDSHQVKKEVRVTEQTGVAAKEGSSGGFYIICTLIVVLGPLTFGYAGRFTTLTHALAPLQLGYTSPALAGMVADLHLTTIEASIFSAIVNVGAMVGAVSGGPLADRFGRKASLAIACVPFAVGWAVIGFSSQIVVLCIGRLLSGFGTGVVSFAVPVYIAEIVPGELRGGLGALNQLALTIGMLLVYLLGIGLGWRTLAIVGIIPPTLLLLGLLLIPESPRWLAMKGRQGELEVALHKLNGKHADVARMMQDIQSSASVQASGSDSSMKMKDLLAPTLRKPLLVRQEGDRGGGGRLKRGGAYQGGGPQIGGGLMILQQFSGINAVMFYAGPIFSAVGYKNPNIPSFGLQAVQVVMTGVAALLLNRMGRKVLLFISSSGLALGAFLLGCSFYLQGSGSNGIAGPLALASLVLYIVAFSLGMGAIPWIIMSEIFPAKARGLAGSVAVMTGWTSSFIVTLTFNYLLKWSAMGAFWLYASECVFTAIFVAVVMPETRGKTLEEIEAHFKR